MAKGIGPKGQAKAATTMKEFASGKLHSGSDAGPVVKNPAQAKAIAMSQARKASGDNPSAVGKGNPHAPGRNTDRSPAHGQRDSEGKAHPVLNNPAPRQYAELSAPKKPSVTSPLADWPGSSSTETLPVLRMPGSR